jgi:hypothetical protein
VSWLAKLRWFSLIGIKEIAATVGFAVFVRGVWMIYKPAAYLIAGAILMWIAWITAVPERRG